MKFHFLDCPVDAAMTAVSSPTAPLAALSEWRALLGDRHVAVDGEALAAADRACCGRSGGVAAVLYPADADQVRHCLAIAVRHGVRLHPVALGRNWGYGSHQPPDGPAVVLSLRRMDRIVALERHEARVRLQPGVTFGALAAWLRTEAPEQLAPETGAGGDTSVLGNALAGGIGKGPYGWMAAHLADATVAFPNGSTVRLEQRTGIASGALAPAHAARYGVVLEATVRLHRAPRLRTLVWARLADGAPALATALDRLLPMALERDPFQQVELLNGARLALQSPGFLPSGGGTVAVHTGWTVGLTLWGRDEAELAWRRSHAKRLLADLPTLATGSEATEVVAERPPLGREGLASAYASTARPVPPDADPDRDGCGVRWIAPRLPPTGAGAVAVLDALGACALAHGFPPALALRLPDGEPVALLGLFWDRTGPAAAVARDDARAAACHEEARRLGLPFYRLDETFAPAGADPGAALLWDALRSWADPSGIMARSRSGKAP